MLCLRGQCVALAGGEFPFAPLAGIYRALADSTAVRGLDPAARRLLDVLLGPPGTASPPAEPIAPGPRARRRARAPPARRRGAARGDRLRGPPLGRRVHARLPARGGARSSSTSGLRSPPPSARTSSRPTTRCAALVAELIRCAPVTHLELTRLTREQTAEQLAAIAGQAVPAGAVDAVHARAHGNPFLPRSCGPRAGRRRFPARLGDTLLARVRALPEEAQRVLRLLAVFGRPSGRSWSRPPPGSRARPSRWPAARCASTSSSRRTAAQLAFRHALVREALYAELLPGEREELHRRRRGRLGAAAAARPSWPITTSRPAGGPTRSRASVDAGLEDARARRLSRGARPLRARARPVGRRSAGAGRHAGARPPRRPPRGGRGGAPHRRV